MTEVQILRAPDVPDVLFGALRTMLDDAFDGEFSDDDWHHALGGWHVFAYDGAHLVAHAAVVGRRIEIGERRWHAGYVEAVATRPGAQRTGHGSAVMRAASGVIAEHFDLGVLSTCRHAFYERLGWQRWQGSTYVLRDGQRTRTEEEDDGIMVLLEASSPVLLTDPIACDSRVGDDW